MAPRSEPPPRRVRVIPYFAVEDFEAPGTILATGATAREALTAAKAALKLRLLVANGRLVEATSWDAPTYPDDDNLLQRVLSQTGGVLIS